MTAQAPRRVTSIRGLLWTRIKDRTVDVAPRALRVAALLAAAWVGALLISGHRAKADIHEVMLGFGAQMMRFDDADRQGAPREMWINGQRMMFATASTRHSLRTVLDYYEGRCMQRDGDFAAEIARIAQAEAPHAALPDRKSMDSTMRFENGRRGFVACVDMGANRVTFDQLSQKLQDFSRSGDLADVGHLRYVYATNERDRTHIVTFWTDDHFLIGRLFPATGDAPGRDVAHMPRPPGARRLLSSWEEGEPESLTIYSQSSENAAGLETYYRRELPRQGWTLLGDARSRYDGDRLRAAELGHARLVGAERDRETAFVVVDDGQDGKGVVTVVTAR